MIRFIRDFRLIPVVLIATICLFALKSFGLVFDGGYLFGDAPGRNAAKTSISPARSAEARTALPRRSRRSGRRAPDDSQR